VGTAILNELTSRNHEILQLQKPKDENNEVVKWIKADAHVETELLEAISGHDLVINAYSAGWTNPNFTTIFFEASKNNSGSSKKIRCKTIPHYWRWR
jgi:putative NADH-flavin reductase